MNDLISRQALKNALTDWQMEYAEKGKDVERFETLGAVIELVGLLPTIDPMKHGKWTPHPTEKDWDVCSSCGLGTRRRFHFNDAVYGGYDVEESFAYCPNCGAQMERSEE